MEIHRIYGSYLVGIMACCLASCGLVYDYPGDCGDINLSIVNDWSLAPGAAPDGMAYIFFKTDEAEPWRFDFPGTKAGKVMLPAGHFGFVSYNDDTYSVFFDGGSYDSRRAFTHPARLPDDTGNGQEVVESPDMLWGCAYFSVMTGYDGLSYTPACSPDSGAVAVHSSSNVLTALQRQITPRYHLVVEDVENLDGVRRMSAALSGLADSYSFATGMRGPKAVTMPFGVAASDSTSIGGEFCTFGLPDGPSEANILYLFVTLTDGRKFTYRFDVTEQVRKAPEPMDVYIRLRGLRIEPSTQGPGGAFGVAVDGWITVDVNIRS